MPSGYEFGEWTPRNRQLGNLPLTAPGRLTHRALPSAASAADVALRGVLRRNRAEAYWRVGHDLFTCCRVHPMAINTLAFIVFWRDSSLALHKGEKPSILYKHLFDLYLGIITVIYSRKQGLRFWLDSRKKRFEAWKIGCLDSGFFLFWRRVIERRKRERELVSVL
jgi:hypothetical protein